MRTRGADADKRSCTSCGQEELYKLRTGGAVAACSRALSRRPRRRSDSDDASFQSAKRLEGSQPQRSLASLQLDGKGVRAAKLRPPAVIRWRSRRTWRSRRPPRSVSSRSAATVSTWADPERPQGSLRDKRKPKPPAVSPSCAPGGLPEASGRPSISRQQSFAGPPGLFGTRTRDNKLGPKGFLSPLLLSLNSTSYSTAVSQ